MGKTANLEVSDSYQAILSAGLGKTLTVRTLILANTVASPAEVDVQFYRSGVGYNIISKSVVPANKTTSVFMNKDLCINLEEGDQLRISANISGVYALCSYDE